MTEKIMVLTPETNQLFVVRRKTKSKQTNNEQLVNWLVSGVNTIIF